jgi:hypothetical protein
LRLNDIEHLVAEGAQKLLGIDRTNAADHSGGEVFLESLSISATAVRSDSRKAQDRNGTDEDEVTRTDCKSRSSLPHRVKMPSGRLF